MENTELCRLCATEKDTFVDGFVSIYSDEGHKFGLEKKIIRCLQIELCQEDSLPKFVCLECCSKLHQCADFVESSARAQSRLQLLFGNSIKRDDPVKAAAKEEQKDSSASVLSATDSVKPQNGSANGDSPSKQSADNLKEKTAETKITLKEADVVPEAPRSRASKRKCRLPVRVSIQHRFEDELADLDNVEIDAAEISRIFDDDDDDDDYEEEVRRKRKGRKKRNSGKVTRKKASKPKARKSNDKSNCEENTKLNEKKDSEDAHDSENGSRSMDGDCFEDNGDDDYDDENCSDEKPKGKGKAKKKKEDDIDLTNYPWMCSDCSEEIASVEELRTHHLVAHKQNPKYMCNTCSKVYANYVGFVTHYRRHKDNCKFCCETCGKIFSNKKALESHRTVHSDKKPHVCAECGKAFRQQSALYVHSRCHLPDELKNKYACDECDKRFSTKPNLVTHKRIHTGIRNFTCDQCGKSFVQKGNLDAHLLTHSTVKAFSCQVCNKSFKTELQLRKHGSVHTGVKPHQCDICGRQFRERGTLREHHRIHTGAMPFSCEFCGKSFRFKGVLTTHRRQHTGERPYSCVECQHHFTNWPNYNKHMKRRHGINTSRQTRTSQTEAAPPVQSSSPDASTALPPPQAGPSSHPLQLQPQPPPQNHQQPHITQGPTALSLTTLCDSQMQPQPTALIHKVEIDAHQPQHIYHHDNSMSQHSIHSQEEDSMSSHHEIYSAHTVHSPHPAHSGHAPHHPISHSGHAHAGNTDDDRDVRYASEREIILGQISRDRDRPHFYNPAPGSSVNTNPYLHQSLHQSLHHSLQQSQLPIPGIYGLPQISLDPSHLEMLHSTAAQHR